MEINEGEVVAKQQQLDGLVDEQRYKLEKIAGIDREEAKVQLMQSIESEARMDCAKRLSRNENEMKMEADRKREEYSRFGHCPLCRRLCR